MCARVCATAYFLQGEVEQIAMMKPKGQTEHDEGMLEYLEDIIGSCRLKEPINTLCRRVELLNEQRGEKVRGNTCLNLLSHSFLHCLCSVLQKVMWGIFWKGWTILVWSVFIVFVSQVVEKETMLLLHINLGKYGKM